MHTAMVLIDLQKALDALDHKILLKKMTCLGFKTSVIKCFESYLSSRKFFVSVNVIFLEVGILNCAVFQGLYSGTTLVFDIIILMVFLSLYQKVALNFVLMIHVFSKAKTLKNSQHYANGEDKTNCILFLKLSLCQN